MTNDLINVGDSVVFAQRYLEGEPLAEFYGDTGEVMSVNEKSATVDFIAHGPMQVPVSDLEPIVRNEEVPIETPSIEFIEDHELGGMQKSQLIAYKILAQEDDPNLNRDINLLLNFQQ